MPHYISAHEKYEDLRGSLSNVAMVQFFQLWDELLLFNLGNDPDKIRWKPGPDGAFSVSSAYDMFFMARQSYPFGQHIWQTNAPSRVRFFFWLAARGRCQTADNLAKKGWPHEDSCALCMREQEDCHHLFVTCEFSGRVWELMRAWISVDFPIPGQIDCSLIDWWFEARRCFRTGYREIFDAVLMLVCWLIWKERNARIFEQRLRSPEQLVEDIKEEINVWRSAAVFKEVQHQ
ncbi:Os07g0663200 [Oryza sativa Japonica Group]|uniref:Os07g0663200 protein n=2 Tax=Oryza sativa subsp. japonica TaxID=39947 RepID=C7J4J4_ORYSJ|nr:Os07g0663200 [Oryza sativa Japonica Group]|eukprot:NP_001175326.1 Os07g0663200 [Oryza sativa Japonica Group]